MAAAKYLGLWGQISSFSICRSLTCQIDQLDLRCQRTKISAVHSVPCAPDPQLHSGLPPLDVLFCTAKSSVWCDVKQFHKTQIFLPVTETPKEWETTEVLVKRVVASESPLLWRTCSPNLGIKKGVCGLIQNLFKVFQAFCDKCQWPCRIMLASSLSCLKPPFKFPIPLRARNPLLFDKLLLKIKMRIIMVLSPVLLWVNFKSKVGVCLI